jgi:hypothetical protein
MPKTPPHTTIHRASDGTALAIVKNGEYVRFDDDVSNESTEDLVAWAEYEATHTCHQIEIVENQGRGFYRIYNLSDKEKMVYCTNHESLKTGDIVFAFVLPAEDEICDYNIEVEQLVFNAPLDFDRDTYWN